MSKRELGHEHQFRHRAMRRERFLESYDFRKGHGLEIGPLDAAVSDKALDDVGYVDVFDTAGLQEHYADDLGVIPELIADVDYPLYLDGAYRDLGEAAKPGAPYDWIIASHVIEHIPDFVGWLRQIADLSADGAALVMAVPDRRYTFDRHRPATTVGQALEAFEAGHSRPMTRALHDFTSSVVDVTSHQLVRDKVIPGREARIYDLAEAARRVERSHAGEYVDCHVWLWTPTDFQQQIRELRAMGLVPWFVESVVSDPIWGEFRIVLRKAVDGAPPEGVTELELPNSLPGWLYDDMEELLRKVAHLEHRVARLKAQSGRRRARIERLLAKVDRLERKAVPAPSLLRRARARAGRALRRS